LAAERKELDEKSPWWGEHLHRYDEVLRYIKGEESILDIACGSGFGSDILAKNTSGVVVGGDIAKEAIDISKQYWQRPNLAFKILDGTKLPFPDNHFDIVVSFETIEHTTEYSTMVQEFARVLKPSGCAFISTPNFPVNSPTGQVTNPYHPQEFTHEELERILKVHFTSVKIEGQQYKRYIVKDLRHRMAAIAEFILLQRGIRKLPHSLQDGILKLLINKPIYPEASDFRMVNDKASILNCTTFFAICKKAKD
jgi:2-polyprenyl-3-methyl-5-hydroxy-6-metoxy-1,4-benzoquinol methylase